MVVVADEDEDEDEVEAVVEMAVKAEAEVEMAVEAEADEVGNNDGGTLSGELNVSDKMLQRYLLFNLNCPVPLHIHSLDLLEPIECTIFLQFCYV